MRDPRTVTLASLAAALVLACGPSGPSEEELVGTWRADRIEYVSTSGLGSVDIVPLGGGLTLELDADGTAVLTFTRVGGHVDVIPGTWESSIDVLKFILGPGSDWSWDMSMETGRLHLSGIGTSWDFDGDGTQDQADWNLVLTRV
jgi:hypothetical protein